MKYEGLTDKQRKGFDIVTKILNKRYPFVVGWDEYETWKNYNHNLYIDLVIDLTKYKEYFNTELWDGVRLDKPYTSLTEPLYGVSKFDKVIEVQKSIDEYMKRLYESIPEEYVAEYIPDLRYTNVRYNRTLGIGSFVFINPPPSEDTGNPF